MVFVKRALLVAGSVFLLVPWAGATVELQNQAKKLGFEVKNCLYCHASPHAVSVMQSRARALNIPEGNCLLCHGNNIPAKLNRRGDWLVAQKRLREANTYDMAWLKDYKEPTPEPTATPTPKVPPKK
jgi:mono/diheme cytochrome c family protein